MALREDDSRDPKREMSFFEQIDMWADIGAKVAVVVVPMFVSLHYMISTEVALVMQQIGTSEARLEGRMNGVEDSVDGLERRFDRLDDKLDRLIEDMAEFRVEVLTWMARNDSSRQTNSDRIDGEREGRTDDSSPPLDESAPIVPFTSLVAAEAGPGYGQASPPVILG